MKKIITFTFILIILFPLQAFGASTLIEAGTDETQDFAIYSSTSGTVTSATDQQHTGPRSIKSVATSADTDAKTLTKAGVVADAGTAMTLWVRFNSCTPSVTTGFIRVTSGGTGSMGLGIDTSCHLVFKANNLGAISKTGATVLAVNTWYRVGWGYVVTSGSNWSTTVYLNGVSEMTASNADGSLTTTGADTMELGIVSGGIFSGHSSILTDWIDDIFVTNATDKADPGNVSVTAKRANANGTANEFNIQLGSSGSGYGTGHSPQENEQPLSQVNGWGVNNTTRQTEEYNIESASTGDVDISGATIKDYMCWIVARVNSTANSPVHREICNNVTATKTMATATTTFTQVAGSTTYPAGTGADTGMDAQYTTTPHQTNFAETGIIFAYIPSTAVAVSSGSQMFVRGVMFIRSLFFKR